MAYYRTYRPQSIHELDKTDVRKRLTVLVKSGGIPHAFLFAGPKGTGKTSTARIVAKVLNCQKVKEQKSKGVTELFEPCNVCKSCLAVVNGSHIDVYEIDAASNRGIDEIRDLREKIHLAPAMGGVKLYIIDEVHMLTREAFNALLKTLEEPPSHAYFILATTEEHKIPDTILSRCTKLKFSKATESELARSLKRVAVGEKIKIADDALRIIAQHAGGSFRDATKLLEQANAESKLTLNEIQKLIGTSTSVGELKIALIEKKTKKCLEIIQQQVAEGIDFLFLIGGILEEIHAMLLAQHGIDTDQSTDKSANQIKSEDLQRIIRVLSRAYGETKTSYIESLPLELAVIEYCSE